MIALPLSVAIILLDPRENAYCVPMEHAASLVAGRRGGAVGTVLADENAASGGIGGRGDSDRRDCAVVAGAALVIAGAPWL